MFTVHVAHRTRAPLVWTSVWTRCPRTPPRAFTPYGDSVLGRAYMVHVDVRYRTRKRNPTGAAERGPSGRATPTPTEKHGRKTPRADGRRDTEVYIITRDPPRCESVAKMGSSWMNRLPRRLDSGTGNGGVGDDSPRLTENKPLGPARSHVMVSRDFGFRGRVSAAPESDTLRVPFPCALLAALPQLVFAISF